MANGIGGAAVVSAAAEGCTDDAPGKALNNSFAICPITVGSNRRAIISGACSAICFTAAAGSRTGSSRSLVLVERSTDTFSSTPSASSVNTAAEQYRAIRYDAIELRFNPMKRTDSPGVCSPGNPGWNNPMTP